MLGMPSPATDASTVCEGGFARACFRGRSRARTRGCWANTAGASTHCVANAQRRRWRVRVLNQHFVDEWNRLLDDFCERNEVPAVQQGVERRAQLGRPCMPRGELLRESLEALLRGGLRGSCCSPSASFTLFSRCVLRDPQRVCHGEHGFSCRAAHGLHVASRRACALCRAAHALHVAHGLHVAPLVRAHKVRECIRKPTYMQRWAADADAPGMQCTRSPRRRTSVRWPQSE